MFKRPQYLSDSESESHSESEQPIEQPLNSNEPNKKLQLIQSLSLNELNKLKSQILKTKLKNESTTHLETTYNKEFKKYEMNFSIQHHQSNQPTQSIQQTQLNPTMEPHSRSKKRSRKDNKFEKEQGKMNSTLDELIKQEKMDSFQQKTMKYKQDDYRYLNQILEECKYCYTPERIPSISVVSLGAKTYLGLPKTIDFVKGHCLIVPTQHVNNTLECDDDVLQEIRNFMKCLIKMFGSQNMNCLFFEQCMMFNKKPHAYIECIPVPTIYFDHLPAYFKQGILSQAEEWSQHKKIIDTTNGMKRNMVKNLPYFHIWFNPNGGMGHVIENELDWPDWFAKQIIAGIMNIDTSKWRRPVDIDYSQIQPRLDSFKKMFDEFDWTKLLDE